MRISDCSSDVCSSDLRADRDLEDAPDHAGLRPASTSRSTGIRRNRIPVAAAIALAIAGGAAVVGGSPIPPGSSLLLTRWLSTRGASLILQARERSEERRVGKEWVIACRRRGGP